MASEEAKTDESVVREPIIVDLGKHKRKRVRRLRKGRGRLAGRVMDALDDLYAEGAVEGEAQPVVVIVRQKRRRRKWPLF